ncbi:hypothetical protein DGWBC_0315 [Dehalogenimonas sp. WBC-2]|nr:hypothetical protein DGWBC_0315 [Dehalogenimonas sp. WBC-2]
MKKLLLFLISAVLVVSPLNVTICHANSGPPPMIIIVVSDASADLKLSIGEQQGGRRDKPLASYFLFYQFDLIPEDFSLQVSSGGQNFSLPINTNKTYNNYYRLDLESRTLTPMESLPGTTSVPLMMVILTLVIEGVVFFLFGFRHRRSWLIFLAVNLTTQILLIMWLGQYASFTSSYDILTLIFGEVWVFIIELIAFMFLLKEHGRWRRASYVILANFLSLILGGYLISVFAI